MRQYWKIWVIARKTCCQGEIYQLEEKFCPNEKAPLLSTVN